MLFALLVAVAQADTITLDTGATIEGDLARYEFGGDCQVSVTEGPLTGTIVIVPCHRVESFVRTQVRTPVPIGAARPGDAEVVAETVEGAGIPTVREPDYAALGREAPPRFPEESEARGDAGDEEADPFAAAARAPVATAPAAEAAPVAEDVADEGGDADASAPQPPAAAPAPGPRMAPSMGTMPTSTRPVRF